MRRPSVRASRLLDWANQDPDSLDDEFYICQVSGHNFWGINVCLNAVKHVQLFFFNYFAD